MLDFGTETFIEWVIGRQPEIQEQLFGGSLGFCTHISYILPPFAEIQGDRPVSRLEAAQSPRLPVSSLHLQDIPTPHCPMMDSRVCGDQGSSTASSNTRMAMSLPSESSQHPSIISTVSGLSQ